VTWFSSGEPEIVTLRIGSVTVDLCFAVPLGSHRLR
jgi:hypothetical protein